MALLTQQFIPEDVDGARWMNTHTRQTHLPRFHSDAEIQADYCSGFQAREDRGPGVNARYYWVKAWWHCAQAGHELIQIFRCTDDCWRREIFVRTTSFSAMQRIWLTSHRTIQMYYGLRKVAVSAHAAVDVPTSQWMQQVLFRATVAQRPIWCSLSR